MNIEIKNEEALQSTPQRNNTSVSEYIYSDENNNICGGLRVHPDFKKLIHPLTDEEDKILEKDILDKGCLDDLKTWKGFIIDGHHRYEICQNHNLPFKTEELNFEDEESVKLWMIDIQMGRRNITDAGKIRYALLSEDIEKERAERRIKSGKSDPKANLPGGSGQVRDIIANKAGVGGRTVEKFKYIEECDPKKADELCTGKVLNGKKLSIDGVFKDLKALEKKENLKQTYSSDLLVESDSYQVIHSSIANLKNHIEANSIDAIITDPPYPEEYIATFEELGEFASHALKDGAPCVVMTGQAYLKEYLNLLSKNLQYH